MKNFSIQSFTLMMILMMMAVSSSPTRHLKNHSTNDLWNRIHQEARNLTKQELPEKFVKFKDLPNDSCVREFFCLAEKSLKTTHLNETKNLLNFLHKFNRSFNESHPAFNITCVLDNHVSVALRRLVTKIKDCSRQVIDQTIYS